MRCGRAFCDAGRHIDNVAEYVVAFAKAHPSVNTDSQFDPFVLRKRQIQLQQLLLNLHCCVHGRARAGKLRHHGIADGLDHAAVMLLDNAGGQFGVAMDHSQSGRIPEALEEAGRANDIGKEHRQGVLMPAQLFVDLGPRLQERVNVANLLRHFGS